MAVSKAEIKYGIKIRKDLKMKNHFRYQEFQAGLRVYAEAKTLNPKVLGGLGVAIISPTNQGYH